MRCMETVGEATWAHSLRSLRPGGRIVISGATSGSVPPADLSRVFFLQLSVVGSTMGTRAELGRLMQFCEQTGCARDRPDTAADQATGRLRRDDLRRPVRQGRVHGLAPGDDPPECYCW